MGALERERGNAERERELSLSQAEFKTASICDCHTVIIRGRRSVVGFFSVLPGGRGVTYRPLVTTRTAEGKSGGHPIGHKKLVDSK